MKRLALLLITAPILLLTSCAERVVEGHGATKAETRQLSSTDFDMLDISAPVDAHVTVGGAPSLSFDGYANVLPHLRVEVRGRTLRIYVDEATDLSTDKNIIANISLPALTGLDISGSSDAVVTGPINTRDFNLDVSGASTVDIRELHVQSFKSDMSGSTHLILGSGDINTGSFDVSGSGEIEAFGVAQQKTALDLSGSADAKVNVATKLDIQISGSGSVAYKGHPTSIHQDISGSGSVTDAN